MTISVETGADIQLAQKWLRDDQYSHGEWGRCEDTDPTSNPRTLEISRIKPRFFTSSQAALAMRAVSDRSDPHSTTPYTQFFEWMRKLRHADGHWTSASGSKVPFGNNREWSECRNLRHTAKALDLLLLKGDFIAGDVATLLDVVVSQNSDGSFPQHPGESGELWSTAYALNLLIRLTLSEAPASITPKGYSPTNWILDVRHRIDGARTWLCSQCKDGLWNVPQKDPVWITEAVLAEIGAHLSLNRPDLCREIVLAIRRSGAPLRGLTYWCQLLVLHCLDDETQQAIRESLKEWTTLQITPNTYEMACSVRAFWFRDRPDMTSYLINLSKGHESLMTRFEPWQRSEYLQWCVANTEARLLALRSQSTAPPADLADAWAAVIDMIDDLKHQVAERELWKALVDDDDNLRSEDAIQAVFWGFLGNQKDRGIKLSREPRTGRGPVDFSFQNGTTARLLIEVKLATNPRVDHGLVKQLPTYMSADRVEAGLLVVVGNCETHRRNTSDLEMEAKSLQTTNQEHFIRVIYVDAMRKPSASKV